MTKNLKKPSMNQLAVIDDLAKLKQICQENGIRNTVEYRARYRELSLPAHPERLFKNEWVSYKDFFEISDYLPYEQVKKEVIANGIKTKAEYLKWLNTLDNPIYPRTPEQVYGYGWEDWFSFCGKEKPFKPKFISEEYSVWREKIEEFMKVALGAHTKVSLLCRFVRTFVEKYDKSKTPHELLTKKRVIVKPFRDELDKLETETHRLRLIRSVNEFLNHIINTELTEEDEETGEIVRVMNARNPFELFANGSTMTGHVRTETTKPCLQYYFVRKAQDWILPRKAKTFRELEHIQKFDADWHNIPEELIDYSDPDCVVKKLGSKFLIWCPTDWIHTFALTKVPLRGRQIAYNDSGEGDEEIADIDSNGKIIWVKNQSEFAGSTKNQSFIKKMSNDDIGMYVTTNKTSASNGGYSIPWIPDDLAYWLVRLRKWQQKYNPIQKPTPWTKCKRPNMNELQLKARGVNCFLFRAFNDIEPKNPSLALTMRLAATLYHVQPSSLKLAEREGNEYQLSKYTSKYTPHSMRVSLITAYVMEMGMPVEIVMKLVGHSSIVMSIYYCKISQGDIRKRLEKAEKNALKNQATAIQSQIEQNKIESVKNTLVANNEELLRSLDNSVPAGNYIFRDYGICPFAATRCDDGGEILGTSTFYSPVPSGYLGVQNCIRCRHFITGPAFLGGLISITNEILLETNHQAEICQGLQDEVSSLNDKLAEIDRKEYMASVKRLDFDKQERRPLEFKLRKLESEYESAAKKMDMSLCDLQSAYKLVQMCQATVSSPSTNESGNFSLIKMQDSEVMIELEESSYFFQLHEVCENATIYESSNPSRAILPRSQYLDRMAVFNQMAPSLFMLSESDQLNIGNQLVNLMKARLKSWHKVDMVVEGKLKLSDLVGEERIEPAELEVIFKQTLPNTN